MLFLKCRRLPWQVKRDIVSLALGNRCQLCGEGVGLLCRIDNVRTVFELRCLSCVMEMLDDLPTKVPEGGLEGGICLRYPWSFAECVLSISLGTTARLDLSSEA